MREKTCLFHATPAVNAGAILKEGLLTPRDRARLQNMPVKDMQLNADTSDVYSVYLGKMEALNYPFEIETEPVAMLQVCFSPEESAKFLPDDDYVTDYIEVNENVIDQLRGFSRASKVREYLRKPKFWKASLEAGYGIRHEGSIAPDHVVDCDVGHFSGREFIKESKCPGF